MNLTKFIDDFLKLREVFVHGLIMYVFMLTSRFLLFYLILLIIVLKLSSCKTIVLSFNFNIGILNVIIKIN